jgi:sensor histidine kinase regulating citrate/malate metabolism
MRLTLRMRLLGTIVGAIVLFFVISVVAARVVLQRDLMALGATQVTDSAGAFGGYWDSRAEQIKLLVSQAAVSQTIRGELQTRNVAALQSELANAARTSGFSFLTIVDAKGNVVARASGLQAGSLASDPRVRRALTGETVSTPAILGRSLLAGEGLAQQAEVSVGTDRAVRGLALVAAAPISDRSERTIGAVYGGVLMNRYYDVVDAATRALGGASALLAGDTIVASTIARPDGTRVADRAVGPAAAVVQTGTPYTGLDTEGGTEYLTHIDPIRDERGQVIGARWYGFPLARIDAIVAHMTRTVLLWGVIAALLALALALPIVERLSKTIAERSSQVRRAAKELGVVVVGSEVAGDHVAMTKAAVERSSALIAELAAQGDPTGKVAELRALSDELQSDVTVIDTLSQEMTSRMKDATNRVAELNDVAAGLNTLVTGEAG